MGTCSCASGPSAARSSASNEPSSSLGGAMSGNAAAPSGPPFDKPPPVKATSALLKRSTIRFHVSISIFGSSRAWWRKVFASAGRLTFSSTLAAARSASASPGGAAMVIMTSTSTSSDVGAVGFEADRATSFAAAAGAASAFIPAASTSALRFAARAVTAVRRSPRSNLARPDERAVVCCFSHAAQTGKRIVISVVTSSSLPSSPQQPQIDVAISPRILEEYTWSSIGVEQQSAMRT
mmetsp:Transcript_8561/g.28172  ORF Transcript_8561/g.28172 Transcript_8561/m.28172 type:complete len:237 (+) Transcript_8561:421-1131(+)